jgi:hypothetical protein
MDFMFNTKFLARMNRPGLLLNKTVIEDEKKPTYTQKERVNRDNLLAVLGKVVRQLGGTENQ